MAIPFRLKQRYGIENWSCLGLTPTGTNEGTAERLMIVLRVALRQVHTCEPAASILSALDRKVLGNRDATHRMHRKAARLDC